MLLPVELRTARLVLRPWQAEDAAQLHPILEANWEHLAPWIPARVADPASVPVLAQRLAGYATDFAGDREWRYGIFVADGQRLLGELSLFSRAAMGRVAYADADRAEVGYWLRTDATGQGFATEAARSVLAVAATLSRFACAEIRCDARNASSAAVPRRLGFVHTETIVEPAARSTESPIHLQVWTSALSNYGDE
jgi:RimJ/RimL family protein N-acetyltransferase